MDLNFILELSEMPDWRILQKEILNSHFPFYQREYRSLDSYSLVHVLVDEEERPVKLKGQDEDVSSFMVFTSAHLVSRVSRPHSWEEAQGNIIEEIGLESAIPKTHIKTIMLGELVFELRNEKVPSSIKINPLLLEVAKGVGPFYFCDEVLFAPILDNVTKKFLISDPQDAKALLGMNPDDQSRFGIEIIFYMITNRDLPDEREERENILKEKIEEMAFMAPRVPLKKGSGSFLTIILNLENEIEEKAFIRDYKMFDNYSDPIFVTSGLKLLTGKLEEIHYNGAQVDTIFTPLINWQKQNQAYLNRV
jgi:hypothetical protein